MTFWQTVFLVLVTNLVAFVLGATLAGLAVRHELSDKFDELRRADEELVSRMKQTGRVSDLSGKLH